MRVQTQIEHNFFRSLTRLWCRVFGHRWMAYGFDFDVKTGKTAFTDKCLRCNKESGGLKA